MAFLTQIIATHSPVIQLDATGLNCPLPLLKLKQALNGLGEQEGVYMITSDKNSPIDIERFCKKNGHQFLCFQAGRLPRDVANKNAEDTICHLIITKG